MADIRGFKGILYNKEKAKNISLVIAPPYDVISPEEQEHLYMQSPYNIVRLIKGKELPDDNERNNSSSRANEYFQVWLREGILTEDIKETIYVTQDEYTLSSGVKRVRKGFVALFKLEKFGEGSIFPHEKTLSGPKADRFRLMKACSANFSPIFSLYTDRELRIENQFAGFIGKTPPDIEILSQQRILHRLWRIADPLVLERVIDIMKGLNIFIADGHHRYETALKYQAFIKDKMGDQRDATAPDYCLMYFSNTEDEGLSILPYHRIVKNIPSQTMNALLPRLKEWFNIRAILFDGISLTEPNARKMLINLMAQNGINHTSFGLFMGGQKYYLLVLRPDIAIERIIPNKGSIIWKSLDVNILHSLIFSKLLEISPADFEKKEKLAFISDNTKAIEAVNLGGYQATFLVNPTKIEQVIGVATNHEKMPQKSTFFYPKLPSGLVLRRIG